jgi:predicted metalloendopeptidase
MYNIIKYGGVGIGIGTLGYNLYKYYNNQQEAKNNYYRYVNKEWLNNTKIPSDFAQYTNFHKLMNDNYDKLKNIAENDDGTVGKLYKACMNIPETKSEKVEQLIKNIKEITTHQDLLNKMGNLWSNYGVNTIFYIITNPDDKNSNLLVPNVVMCGLNLPDKTYYDEEHKVQKEAYMNYVNNIGLEYNYVFNFDNLWNYEKRLAEKHLTTTEKRDPKIVYNKMGWEEFRKYFKNYCDGMGNLPKMDYVIVDNVELCKFYQNEFNSVNLDILKDYVVLRIIDFFAKYDVQKQRDLHFEFHDKILSGIQKPKELWKNSLSIIDQFIGDEIAKIYIKKYYPIENRNYLNNIVKLIKDELKISIKNNNWMEESTKNVAYSKLEKMEFDFGNPEEYHNYDGLWEKGDNNNLIDMVIDFYRWNWINNNLNKFYTPVNNKLWDMLPHVVNACYNTSKNKMMFPAGILQPPFFDISKNMGYNLGTIGMIIGHEMTHGFDDQGRQYDQDGNLRDWWTNQDSENFKNHSVKVKKQFEEFHVQDKPVNGDLTMGENIADIGGLRLASEALVKYLDENKMNKNINENQEWKSFFEGFAQIFKSIRTPELELKYLVIDPHSPPEARTNISLKNNHHFKKYMNLKEGDKMYLSDDDMVMIW